MITLELFYEIYFRGVHAGAFLLVAYIVISYAITGIAYLTAFVDDSTVSRFSWVLKMRLLYQHEEDHYGNSEGNQTEFYKKGLEPVHLLVSWFAELVIIGFAIATWVVIVPITLLVGMVYLLRWLVRLSKLAHSHNKDKITKYKETDWRKEDVK